MAKFIETLATWLQAIETSLRNEEAFIHYLKNHIGKLTNLISRKQKGSLLDNTKLNLRKHMKAVALKVGKEMRGKVFKNLVKEEFKL